MYHFFAMLSRMKYINRWGLMRNTRSENICEHSLDVGLIAHALEKKYGEKTELAPLDDTEEKEANDYVYHRFVKEN